MHAKTKASMTRKVETLQKQLGQVGSAMRGSIVKLGTKCGNPKCKCARGEKHQQYYFSLTKDKRTKLIFLGNKRLDLAQRYVDNYKRIVDIIEEMTAINMELLRAGAAS